MVKMLQPRIKAQPSRIKPATVSATCRMRGDAWMQLRAQVLARDCGLCQVCKGAGRLTLAHEVDHVRELADGGTDDMGNLAAICRPCHKVKTGASQRLRLSGAT
mgnify:FL=1